MASATEFRTWVMGVTRSRVRSSRAKQASPLDSGHSTMSCLIQTKEEYENVWPRLKMEFPKLIIMAVSLIITGRR